MHSIADARGLRLECRNQLPTHAVVVGDATRVRQILINLLGNAIKFADRGEVSLTVSQHGDALRLTVRDGGLASGRNSRSDCSSASNKARVRAPVRTTAAAGSGWRSVRNSPWR
ncbi:HSP90-like ATPase family protein [Xanthomonas citri pv. mangiferaeindicae LMG 941]|nr:HSP90-like ATPase family protein [Xanthomonas citri pv. mangiferaeindicae]CCG39142.1 HSP90-like ATPase family protein [Xanthomonas citri pv. mangiferaeindicae LMG 941]